MRMCVQSLALLSGLRICVAMSCGVGRRCSLGPVLLWLWCNLAAVAPIQPLPWEPPYAEGTALKSKKKEKKKDVYTCIAESLWYIIVINIINHLCFN